MQYLVLVLVGGGTGGERGEGFWVWNFKCFGFFPKNNMVSIQNGAQYLVNKKNVLIIKLSNLFCTIDLYIDLKQYMCNIYIEIYIFFYHIYLILKELFSEGQQVHFFLLRSKKNGFKHEGVEPYHMQSILHRLEKCCIFLLSIKILNF